MCLRRIKRLRVWSNRFGVYNTIWILNNLTDISNNLYICAKHTDFIISSLLFIIYYLKRKLTSKLLNYNFLQIFHHKLCYKNHRAGANRHPKQTYTEVC